MAAWIGIGIALGVAIGAMYDNVAIGVVIGLVLGLAFASERRRRTNANADPNARDKR